MKAFIVDRYGSDCVRLGEMPNPQPGESDVLVQIHAASVNPVGAIVGNSLMSAQFLLQRRHQRRRLRTRWRADRRHSGQCAQGFVEAIAQRDILCPLAA